jgi:hypothetical protein
VEKWTNVLDCDASARHGVVLRRQRRGGRFKGLTKYVFFEPARTPGTPNIGRKWGPWAPQISSDWPRKSLDFEIRVGDQLGTLSVSKSKRLFSI